MFFITYNYKGFSSIKASYIKQVLNDCDVLFLQETWLLQAKTHLLQELSDNFFVYAKSSIPNDSLLSGRPYGGTAIFISRHLK